MDVDTLNKAKSGGQNQNLHGVNELIRNLDHELSDVRLRALKCLLRKLDYSIITSESLSERIDLLHRLSGWLRNELELMSTGKQTATTTTRKYFHSSADGCEATSLIIDLLYRLSQHESFRRLIVTEKVDSLLTQLRPKTGGELRPLIDRLLDLVCTDSFHVNFNESPKPWNNTSLPVTVTRTASYSPRLRISDSVDYSEDQISWNNIITTNRMEQSENSKDLLKWTKNCHFGIYKTVLGKTDRRLLSSTVESLLSPNESLVFMTVSFMRDVLLNDFPAEIFVQEVALSLSVLEVAGKKWDDSRIEDVAVQVLIKLSTLLRQRFAFLNSSEFYQFQSSSKDYSSSQFSGSDTNRLSAKTVDNGDTDYFINNLIQILKGISRAILFQCDRITLWILMENFAFTLLKCSSCFPVDSRNLSMALQEILLDMTHCYDQYSDVINTPALALTMSSILRSLHINDEVFIIANDVRRVFKQISCCPRLFHHWSEVYHHFLHYVSPFDSTLEPATKHMELVCKGLEEICNVLDLSKEIDMTTETFLFAKESIPYLSYIESENSLNNFIERALALCTNPMFSNLLPNPEERLPVVLQLMAHSSDAVRRIVYSSIRNLVKTHFGPGKSSSKTNEENIIVSLVLHREFIKEILHFALKDSISEVQHYGEEIVLFLLKCKPVVSRDVWDKVFARITSFMSIIEIQADPQTVIGKAVLKLCDPMSNDHGLNGNELLCSNLRLLYSCNSRVREEASDRIMKILSATETGSNTFRYASYSNYTLASIFNIGRNLDMSEISNPSDTSFQSGTLLKNLEICREEGLESNVRKNSLVQLAMMLEDVRSHDTFTKQGGLELVIGMISKVASEKDYKYSLDMWPPVVRILKLLALKSAPCRKVLAGDNEVLINLTCGMFSLRNDDRFRCDIVHLISLILFFNHFRLSEDGEKCLLPQILLIRYRIPINAEPYMTSSAHTTSAESPDAEGENKNAKSLAKYPMENIFKTWWTFGRNQTNGNKAESPTVLKAAAAFKKKKENLKSSNTKLPKENIVDFLFAIQNATDHHSVVNAINGIWENVFPLILNARTFGNYLDYVCRDAPWRDSFYRFLSVEPTCNEDEELLIKVLELCKYLISNVNECHFITSWIIPLCLEKGCACLRLMLENSSKNQFAGTMLPSILRSLMDIYNVLLIKHESVVSDHIDELFNTLCQILHLIAEDGYSNTALLHPVLHNLSLLYTYPGINERLKKNSPLLLLLLFENAKAIISIQERSGSAGDSFRNRGVLYYASLSMLHLISITVKLDKDCSLDGVGQSLSVIPFLWMNGDSRIRAAGFQITQILTGYKIGTSVLLSSLDPPSSIWIAAYEALTDLHEVPVVKQKAAGLLLNLIASWPELKESSVLMQNFRLPRWNVVEELTNVIANICWCSHMSMLFKNPNPSENGQSDGPSDASHLITPKVLSSMSKLIIAINCTDMEVFHPESFTRDVATHGLCPLLFRIAGSYQFSNDDVTWWVDSCFALACVVEAIISLSQKDRSIAVILIGDKRNLNCLVQLLVVEAPSDSQKDKCVEVLSSLWINIFTLLSILCMDAGQNFEDLERNIWKQKDAIFLRLIDWLQDVALAKCRKVALFFSYRFLSMLASKQSEKDSGSQGLHPILCTEWKQRKCTYGRAMSESLMTILENSVNLEEKLLVLNTLATLFSLSETAKRYAIESNMVETLVGILHSLGLKFIDSGDVQYAKKNCNQWYDELISVLTTLCVILYGSMEAKQAAFCCSLADTIHKILKWWTFTQDRSLLHLFMETLLNFTEEFPLGSQSLTATTNLVGVGPKKVATPQSLLHEILTILQAELDILDKNPNLKTVDIVMSLLKNTVFVPECRTVLTKSGVPYFIKKLHVQEIKKWGPKQHYIKSQYLDFIVHTTIHSDMQTFIPKIPESVDILVALVGLDHAPTSSLALRIIRNLTFNSANRARFLSENGLMLVLSNKLQVSEDLEEIESAAVGVWGLIANSEKGKLLAKRTSCVDGINKAIVRVRKMEQRSNDLSSEKRDLSSVLNLLGNVCTLLSSSVSIPLGSSQSVNQK